MPCDDDTVYKNFEKGEAMLLNKLKIIRMSEFFLNKKEFSKIIEVSEQQYSRYENGLSNPSLEVAMTIAVKLDRAITDIWYFDNE